MSVLLGWLQIVALVAAAGIAVGSLLAASITVVGGDGLLRLAPRQRFVGLAVVAVLPVLLGLTVPAVVFAPSLLDAVALVSDHCHQHLGHAFHLCFVHDRPPSPSIPLVAVTLGLVGWMTFGWLKELLRSRRIARRAERLADLGEWDRETDTWRTRVDQPFAIVSGFLSHRIVVSDALERELTERQFQAVLAHERAHVRRHDSLAKLILRLSARFHLPGIRQRLLDEIDLACEQACDESAADAVGDPLTVAEAILSAERAQKQYDVPEPALRFGGGTIERRIQGLLNESWRRPGPLVPALLLVVTIKGAVFFYEEFHHSVETFVGLLF